jgi:hypothetical protein
MIDHRGEELEVSHGANVQHSLFSVTEPHVKRLPTLRIETYIDVSPLLAFAFLLFLFYW